ncbi:MAG: carboxypeptidase regulatory-like domain-containing protein [Longimicrobiales bacterium]
MQCEIQRLSTLAAVASVILVILFPSVAPAQVVQGTVVVIDEEAPVVGAVVELVDDAGTRWAATLSDEFGAYLLRAPAAGRYRVRVERIGVATTSSPLFDLGSTETVEQALRVALQPVSLEGISVTGESRCRLHADAPADVQQLWDQARKVLNAASLLTGVRMVSFRSVSWERDLHPRTGHVLAERVSPLTVVQDYPFKSLPEGKLLRDGFVVQQDDTTTYYAPDAHVLLSDAFLSNYCFRSAEGEPGLVGLAFEPVERQRGVTGLGGVLWIDRATAELRRLEFEYLGLPRRGSRLELGGEIQFAKLDNGAWIVGRWNLRIPRYAIVDGMTTRDVARVREAGGEVRNVFLGGNRRSITAAGTLQGRLLTPAGRAAPDVLVFLAGTSHAARTDRAGNFRLSDVLAGVYELAWYDADGDPAAERVVLQPLKLPGRDTSIVTMMEEHSRSPSALCSGIDRSPGFGMVAGVVLAANGMPVGDVVVRFTDRWDRMTETRTDRIGRFRFCNARPGSGWLHALMDDALSTSHIVVRADEVTREKLWLESRM